MTKILEHKHLMVRAEVKSPPKDTKMMEKWLSDLVSALGMKELAPPRAVYSDMVGNRGLTCDVLLNTSNAVVHTWDEVDPGLFMCDIYTCGALDQNVVFKLLEIFDPVKIEYMFIDREHGLHLVEKGKI